MTAIPFELLHRQECGRLKRFFQRRLRNRDDAADAMQETFLRLIDVAPRTSIENPQAYLFQIAHTVAIASNKRVCADHVLFDRPDDAADICDGTPDAEHALHYRQCLLLTAKAIEALPARCQEVFILSRIHGLANGEIATRLGISRNMVEKHIIKALIHCRKVRCQLSF